MMFGNQNSFGSGPSSFANTNQQTSPSPFSNSAPNSNTPLFPSTNTQNTQPQQQPTGFFSGTQPTPTNNAFGTNNNAFGTGNGGGVFGNANSFQNQGNNSGTGAWNSSSSTNATGMFGGSNTSNNSNGNGIFGNQLSQGNGAPTFGVGNNKSPTNGGIFGNNQQEKPLQANSFGLSSNNAFGNQQQTQNGFGQNGAFGNSNSGQAGQPQNAFGNTSPFGSSNNSGFSLTGTQQNGQSSDGNKFGNTSWGFGIGGQAQQPQPQQGEQSQQRRNFAPIKSKNQKIDHKHLVKCVINLDQNTGMSLNQLRINYMNGTGKNPTNSAFSNPSFGNIGQPQQPSSSPFSLQTNTNPQNTPLNSTNSSFTSAQNTSISGNNASSPFKTLNTSTFGFGNASSSPFGGNSTAPNQTNALSNGTNQLNTSTSSTANNNGGLFGGSGTGMFNLGSKGQNQNASSGLGGGNSSANGKSTFSFGNTSQNNQNTPPTQANQPTQGTAFGFSNIGNQLQSSILNTNLNTAQNKQNGAVFGSNSQQTQPVGGTTTTTMVNNTPSLFGGEVQPHFPVTHNLGSIPNADPQILEAIMNIGFYSQEFRSRFQPEKTPFDKLIEDPFLGTEEDKRRSQMSIYNIDPDSITNRAFKLSTKNEYKFKSPYDFGEEEYLKIVNENEEKGDTRKMNYRKKRDAKDYEWGEVKKILNIKQNNKVVPKEFKFSEKNLKEEDLPIAGDYTITPSLNQLKMKKPNQLKKVPNVTIQNEYGKVAFKEPVNLYRKDVVKGIEILPNSIDIMDRDWDRRRCEMTFRNFGNFTKQPKSSHQKFYRKMQSWIEKHEMRELDFDRKTGDLLVEL